VNWAPELTSWRPASEFTIHEQFINSEFTNSPIHQFTNSQIELTPMRGLIRISLVAIATLGSLLASAPHAWAQG
jgi:hypothetical protein